MKRLCLVTAMIALVLSSAPVIADDSASLALEVRQIREALDTLVELQLTRDRTDLVLKRLELHERRLDPLAQRLVMAETEYRKVVDNLQSLERLKEQDEKMIEDAIKEGNEEDRASIRLMLDNIERTMEQDGEREDAALLRVRELEDEIADRQRDIEILDEIFATFLEESE